MWAYESVFIRYIHLVLAAHLLKMMVNLKRDSKNLILMFLI